MRDLWPFYLLSKQAGGIVVARSKFIMDAVRIADCCGYAIRYKDKYTVWDPSQDGLDGTSESPVIDAANLIQGRIQEVEK